MKNRLARIFDEILREIEVNPGLRARIEQHLGFPQPRDRGTTASSRARNKRDPAALDPYAEFERSEEILRQKLSSFTLEQLKDIVSEYALDSSRLALKWKDRGRLEELIVTTIRSRLEKGDVFRTRP
jgi:hypothetical protein